MKRLSVVFTFISSLLLAQDSREDLKTHWIWKGDPTFYTYQGSKDFGMYIERGKIKYQRLFPKENATLLIPKNDEDLDPIRLTDSGWVDLSKKYKVLELSRFYNKVIPGYWNINQLKVMSEWDLLLVTVDDVLKKEHGAIVFPGNKRYGDKKWFVYLHELNQVAEGETYQWMLKKEGTFVYRPEFGDEEIIRKYYYGYVPETKSEWAEAIRWIEKEYAPKPLNLKDPNSKPLLHRKQKR